MKKRRYVTEISQLSEIVPWVCSNTVLFIDLDNTILHPQSIMGSDQWGRYYRSQLRSKGKSDIQVWQDSISIWKAVAKSLRVKPSEEGIPQLFSELSRLGVQVFGLTAREPNLKQHTKKHLSSIGVELSRFLSKTHKRFSHLEL